jgi:aryl-alcohol dehydrogenase-like predicted oxidoreductase
MKNRNLGKSGIQVSPLCFGGNVFGWTADEQTSFKLLDAFTETGFNFIDTADIYSMWVPGNSGGESERIIGKWMKERNNRSKVIVATKVGGGQEAGKGLGGLKPDYIMRRVEESLKRLQTDYIDLYQSHVDDLDTPMEQTLQTYAQLIKQGKVRAIGASNYTAERLSASQALSEKFGYPAYQCLQPLYNLCDRKEFETELAPYCLENKISVNNYYSLASGFLTGKYRSEADLSQSPRGYRVKGYLTERGFRILKALDEVSKHQNTTPAAVSLAWLLSRPAITSPIVSATGVKQWKELVKATELVLEPASIELLNEASEGE